MSEEKKSPRAVAEIQGEYQGGCTRAGHIQYQISVLEKDLELVNSTLRDLNFEAAASQRAAEDEAKAAAQPQGEQANG